ncbi:MAG: hypothetical protein ACLFSZ_10490 [Puniceicoccaceae bacterium]
MKTTYRDPVWEEGKHNLILQNRCGNRLTLLLKDDGTELEFVYKPNAFRRKDFRARNFSNRDNQTVLFAGFRWPDIRAGESFDFHYDPFHTRIGVAHAIGAANQLQVLNLADENAYVLTARAPLLLAFRPHHAFEVRDGLLTESFRDRGEDIVSFIRFRGFEENRYRVLDDGAHLLQILENDPILIGGEENHAQVERILRKFDGFDFEAFAGHNEAAVARDLGAGTAVLADAGFQRVFDLNRRVCWSGLDAGGAAFGALNRIYYLIWVRDGSMSTSHLALAGNPEFARTWAPFLMANPSHTRLDDGRVIEEFGQGVGTRWSKSEDDGLFYAVWSLFTYTRCTGDDRLLRHGALDRLFRITGAHLEKCWDAGRGIMTSDTLGEESLKGSPYYSYDVVNGALQKAHSNTDRGGKVYERVASFYHQVNTYNVLRMLECLAAMDSGETARITGRKFGEKADALQRSLAETFLDAEGRPFSLWAFYTDGTDEKVLFDLNETDCWEYTWAQAQGPFTPLPEAQRRGGLLILDQWPRRERRGYGLCPWNVLNRFLYRERLLAPGEADDHLRDEVAEALTPTEKYPMTGALHEDHRNPRTHRALPFTAGSFIAAMTGRLLLPLAQGLAVAPGGLTRGLRDYRYQLASIDVETAGEGGEVAHWSLNGEGFRSTLQIPELRLRPGRNRIEITCGADEASPAGPRLLFSDAQLLEAHEAEDGSSQWEFASAVPAELVFDRVPADWKPRVTTASGEEWTPALTEPDANGLVRLSLPGRGAFNVVA